MVTLKKYSVLTQISNLRLSLFSGFVTIFTCFVQEIQPIKSPCLILGQESKSCPKHTTRPESEIHGVEPSVDLLISRRSRLTKSCNQFTIKTFLNIESGYFTFCIGRYVKLQKFQGDVCSLVRCNRPSTSTVGTKWAREAYRRYKSFWSSALSIV